MTKQYRYQTIPKNFQSDKYFRFHKLANIIMDIINQKRKKEIVLLDIGCGDGQFMKYLKNILPNKVNIRYIGIDKYVTEKSFDFQLINNDVENKIELPSKYADIIIAAEILEHLKFTDCFIKETKRILKNDGDILITTPNLSSYFNRLLLLFGYQPYNSEVSDLESGFGLGVIYKVLGRPKYGNSVAGHLRLFTIRALEDFIKYYDLKIKSYYPVHFSSSREDNKRKTLIKLFFNLDKVVANLFPKLATGIILHIRKENNVC